VLILVAVTVGQVALSLEVHAGARGPGGAAVGVRASVAATDRIDVAWTHGRNFGAGAFSATGTFFECAELVLAALVVAGAARIHDDALTVLAHALWARRGNTNDLRAIRVLLTSTLAVGVRFGAELVADLVSVPAEELAEIPSVQLASQRSGLIPAQGLRAVVR